LTTPVDQSLADAADPNQVAPEDRPDPNQRTAMRRLHHLAIADVDPDMMDRTPVEKKITGTDVVDGHARSGCVLRT
jgi:hypothetical protein